MRFALAILSFLLPATAALADGPTAPGGGDVTVARVAVIGGSFGNELLRYYYSRGSDVLLGRRCRA